jgi:ribonuclease HII
MAESINDIKKILSNSNIDDLPKYLESFSHDKRAGVQTVLSSFRKKYKKHQSELLRVKKLNSYEDYYYSQGLGAIGGIDEVGRGPLAGPVVAACVVLPQNTFIPYINDSKKLSAAKREEIYTYIKQKAIHIGLGCVDNKAIDEINILNATYEAMRQAISQIPSPGILLIDAVRVPGINIPQHPIISGDSLSISIAAASIIAKVTRDSMMCAYAKKYPGYDFESNKGYGTKKHLSGIKQFGLCPIHRKSFLSNIV